MEATILQVIPEEHRTAQTALPWFIPEKGGGDRTGRTRTEQALCEAQSTRLSQTIAFWSYANGHRAVGLDRTATLRNYSGRAAMLREEADPLWKKRARFSEVSYADSALAKILCGSRKCTGS